MALPVAPQLFHVCALPALWLAILALGVQATPPPPLPPLPTGDRAPHVIPAAPKPAWSWERIPTSFHGAVKDREFTDAEIDRLARYQMATIEKWYTPCGSAGPPHQSGPECAVERKAEGAFAQIRARAAALGLVRPTAILYWNSMFDFSMYAAHQGMMDLEAEGVHAFLRDETGTVIRSLSRALARLLAPSPSLCPSLCL
eukprot:COSAG03_NODE_3081_length_2239_cov_5.724299_3_plen_200_part_00